MPPVEVEQIPDDSALFRRIRPDQLTYDENEQRIRPSSAAFKDEHMSVDVGAFMARHGMTSRSCIQNNTDCFVAAFSAAFAKGLGQRVEHRPMDENPIHGQVEGRKSGAISKRFAKEAGWEAPPPEGFSIPQG